MDELESIKRNKRKALQLLIYAYFTVYNEITARNEGNENNIFYRGIEIMNINQKKVKVFVALNDNEERTRCIRILEYFNDVL